MGTDTKPRTSSDADTREVQLMDRVAGRVAADHPHVDPGLIHRMVHRHHEAFSTARIREYIPILVEREVRAALATRAEPVTP
jgi:hypothetical protein